MRSFGGRASQFQRVRRVKPPRAPAATFPASSSICVEESWNGATDAPGGVIVSSVSFCASTPDSGPLSITGDIDIRARLTLNDWTPSGERQIVTKMLDTAQGYLFRMIGGGSGTLDFDWTDSGGGAHSATATTDTGFDDGTTHWVRVTMDVNNGAGGRDIAYYGSDDGVTWTQIGTTVTQAGTTSIKNTTDNVYVGGVDAKTGILRNVEIRDGIGGTVVADPDFTAQAVGTASFSDGSNTWSILSDAAIVDPGGLLGPDLAWTGFYGGCIAAAAVVLGASSNQIGFPSGASLALDPPIVVNGDVLTVKAPGLKLLPSAVSDPTGYWSRVQGTALIDDPVGFTDVEVSITVVTVPPLGTSDGDSILRGGVDLYARLDGDPEDGLNVAYWDFSYENKQREDTGTFAAGGGGPDPAEVDQQAEVGLFLSFPFGDDFATYADVTGMPLLEDGDVVKLRVTGTGAATKVTCRVNSTVVFTLDGIDFDDWQSPPDDPHDLDTELPMGERAGLTIGASASDVDTGPGNWPGPWDPDELDYAAIAVDNFRVCSA